MAIVLIVDDNLEDRRMLELLITRYTEHQVLTAANAGEAYKLAPQANLILLDVMMPEVDGIQVFKVLRSRTATRSTPVIFMTAYPASIKNKLPQETFGEIVYLTKPVQKDKLLNQITILLGIKETRQQFQERDYTDTDQLTLLLAAMEQTGDGITVTDQKGRWMVINHAQAALFGYTTAEFMKLAIEDIYEPRSAEQLKTQIIERIDKEGHWEGELTARKKSGEFFSILLSLAVVTDNAGKFLGIMGITKDITVLKKAYADLQKAQEALVRSERLKALGEMVMGISHKFNNLLANILGNTQLLLQDIQVPGMQKRLRSIERAAITGAETVKKLQAFTFSGPEGDRKPVDLKKLLEEVLKITRPRRHEIFHRKGLQIKVETDLSPVPSIAGNEEELKITLFNIISNAIDALPQGGNIRIRNWADHRQIHIQVADDGVGMSPEVLEKAFEPYFTTERPIKSGLGLSEAYGTIKKHGGDITIDSEKGKGTTVEVTLPFSGPPPSLIEMAPPAKAKRTGTAKILIIDDDDNILTLLNDILSAEDYEVTVSTNSRDGLQHALKENFNLIITDLRMADINGLELAQKIKHKSPKTKVALITGWEEALYQIAVESPEVDDVWGKPFTPEVILEQVRKLISA